MRTQLVATSAAFIVSAWIQQPPALVGAQFDVVSIKRNTGVSGGGTIGGRPDGSWAVRNLPIRAFVMQAAPVPVEDVAGLPDWARDERYDIVAKPAPDFRPTLQ